jgi:hypothetical protein
MATPKSKALPRRPRLPGHIGDLAQMTVIVAQAVHKANHGVHRRSAFVGRQVGIR